MTKAFYDVLVIGGGILGLSSAYHIKKNNSSKSVLVLDRYPDVGQGNTGRSNAMFRNTFTSLDNRVLANATIDCYLDLERDGRDLGLLKTGYLWLMDENQLRRNAKHVEAMKENGIEVTEFDKSSLKNKLPQLRTDFENKDEEPRLMGLENVEGAMLGVKCGRLDPSKLCRQYLDYFSNLGGEFSPNTNVKSLVLEAKSSLGIDGEPFVWQESHVNGVVTSGEIAGEIRAETVVLAAGVWMNELLEPIGLDGHVKAKKRQLFTIPFGGDTELESLSEVSDFNELGTLPFTILPNSGCFVKSVTEAREFWVGCDDDLNRPYIDSPSSDLDSFKPEIDYYNNSVMRIVRQYFPSFQSASNPRQMWAGLYSYNTLDYIPFVFRSEDAGIISVGGDSGSGIMKGDSLGRIVDAVYRGLDETELYGGRYYKTSKIGFRARDVEREEWVI